MRAPLGLIYTILVDGRPVVALEATGREAVELCREEWFRTELCDRIKTASTCSCRRREDQFIRKRRKKFRPPTTSC
jgi:hypothetical protein